MTRDEILNMPAGTKMNQTIWWKVFDMEPMPPDNDMLKLPDYSGDIAAAWEVVKNLSHEGSRQLIFELFYDGRYAAKFGKYGYAFCETAPLAICRAALLVVMEFDNE